MKRHTVAILLFLIMLLALSACAGSAERPEIVILPEAEGIPDTVVSGIADTYPESGRITMISWHDAGQTDIAGKAGRIPLGSGNWDYENIRVNTTGTNQTLATYFVTSCAKGSSETLTTEFTRTISSSVKLTAGNAGKPTAAELGISASVTAKITVSRTFSGPPETSPYNSRQYYIRFTGDTGTWSAQTVWQTNPANRPKISGTWLKPTSWAEYSVDRLITD